MPTQTVKVSSKYQVVIPKEIRKKVNLKPKEEVEVTLDIKSAGIIIRPKIKNWAKYMRGLGKEIWRKIDVEKYIKEERKDWDRKS